MKGEGEIWRARVAVDSIRSRQQAINGAMRVHRPDTPQDDWPDAEVRQLERDLLEAARVPPGPGSDPAPATATETATALPYFVQDGGLYIRDRHNTQLTNFTARIIAETTRDNGVERTRCLTLEGHLADGTALPTIDIPASKFNAMEWVVDQWGAAAVIFAGSGTKDHVRTAIQLLSTGVRQRTVYEHVGWRELGSDWVYLHANGAIGADGPVPGIEVALTGELTKLALPDSPTGVDLTTAVRASLGIVDGRLAPDQITIPLLALTFRAPLGSIDFGAFIFGRTGVYKSELAALSQMHYGAGLTSRHFPANWSFTVNAIEQLASMTRQFANSCLGPRRSE
jgi:hypothetical protein